MSTDPREFVKRPADDRLYGLDFAALLLDGATLATVAAAGIERLSGPDAPMTAAGAVIDGTSVRQRLAGGAPGSRHLWRVVAVDRTGNSLDAAIEIRVVGP